MQHLKVKQNSIIDMWTMEFLANTVKLFFPGFGFMWLVEETKRNLPLELDFAHEGCNSEMVGKLLQGHSWLKVPEIEWDLTTDRVLTMEYCDGVHIDDRDAGTNCIKIGLPGKSILSNRKGLLEVLFS